MRILVADDDKVFRILLGNQLSTWGYTVELAGDGGAALAALGRENGPSLAILDWTMPEVDGIEICRRVRANSRGRYLYLLLVTARDTSADLLAGMDAGADDYLAKPVNMTDLRLRVRVASRILEFEGRTRQLFDNAPIAYHETDRDGVIVRVNEAECGLLGYEIKELIGRRVWDFVGPAQAEAMKTAFQLAMSSDRPIEDSEWQLQKRDGEASLIQLRQNQIQNDRGLVTGLRSTMVDITELRRQQELLRQQAADLRRSNSELEQFAYVASHDLQEPLRMIASFTQLLSQRYAGKLDDKADKYLGYVVDGAKRMQCLISDLLALSRVGTRGDKFQATDLNEVLEEALQNLHPAIHDSGAIVSSDGLPTLAVDRGQMIQLIQNLIGNAIKFHGASTPKVHVSAVEVDREWKISVRDNGIGIDDTYSDRVFQIFQRLHTREKYPGTGIGLAICRKILERHNGRIWFDSTAGAGTTFHFVIPNARPECA